MEMKTDLDQNQEEEAKLFCYLGYVCTISVDIFGILLEFYEILRIYYMSGDFKAVFRILACVRI